MSYYDKLSGVSFRQKEIDSLTGEETLVLIAEPDNEYDEYAVRVEADGVMIGWIRKGNNVKISKALQAGKTVEVDDFTITGGEGKDETGKQMNYGVNVKITMPVEENFKKFKKIIPDIGEGFVYFDEDNHVYYSESGQEMQSGSKAEAAEVGEVDMSYALKAVAKSTKLRPEVIQSFWDKNGELSAGFGTIIHDAFDFYIKNQVQLEAYDNIREREHSACNWMPNTVGRIIDQYLETRNVSASQSEVFVRHGLFCGYIDQLLYIEDSVVQIRDYKIINKLKKVKTRSYGSITKYTVQQNFYREILEANGYSVVSMELNTYDGSEWRDVELEEIEIGVKQEN